MKQCPGSADCVAVVAAMATGTSIQEFRDFVGRSDGPYSDMELAKYLMSKDLYLGIFFDNKETEHTLLKTNCLSIEFVPLGRKAYITTKSERYPDLTHALYWDGEQVWDPNHLTSDGRCLSTYNIQEVWPILLIEKDE